jgi:hypothetical protein
MALSNGSAIIAYQFCVSVCPFVLYMGSVNTRIGSYSPHMGSFDPFRVHFTHSCGHIHPVGLLFELICVLWTRFPCSPLCVRACVSE